MEKGWTTVLQQAKLTGAGRPHLQANEYECQLLDGVELQLESSSDAPALPKGLVTLTTHRLIWLHQQSKIIGAIPHAAVCRIFPPKKSIKSMFGSPKMRIQLWSYDGEVALGSENASDAGIHVALIFKGNMNSESFVAKLAEVVEAKAWEADIRNEARQSQAAGAATDVHGSASAGPQQNIAEVRKINTAMAGVSGILRKEQEQREETDKNLHEAFQDLNALMGKAKEMVGLAERMRSKLLAAPGSQQAATEEGEMDKQEMEDWLLSVGVVSPVTKETAGALYHQQLARQLADFIKTPLQKNGGMLAMVDVYCLFNRARGTELISPEDLLQACKIWTSIDVPVTMRTFDSGVMVIQSKSQSDEQVFARLETLVKRPEAAKQGISASDAARALGVAPALAKEHLLAAENKGLLCRDDGEDGLRFFFNFFLELDVSQAFFVSQ